MEQEWRYRSPHRQNYLLHRTTHILTAHLEGARGELLEVASVASQPGSGLGRSREPSGTGQKCRSARGAYMKSGL